MNRIACDMEIMMRFVPHRILRLSNKLPLPQGEGWGEGIRIDKLIVLFIPSSCPSPWGRRDCSD